MACRLFFSYSERFNLALTFCFSWICGIQFMLEIGMIMNGMLFVWLMVGDAFVGAIHLS